MIITPSSDNQEGSPRHPNLHNGLSKQRDSSTSTQSSTTPGIVPARPKNYPFLTGEDIKNALLRKPSMSFPPLSSSHLQGAR